MQEMAGVKQRRDESVGQDSYPERRRPNGKTATEKVNLQHQAKDAGIQTTPDVLLSHGSLTSESSDHASEHCGVGTTSEKSSPAKDGVAETTNRVKICMLKSVSKFTIPVKVEDVNIEAVVDSAAEVTIVSDKIYESLTTPPKKLYEYNLIQRGGSCP